MPAHYEPLLFSGSSHPVLAQEVADQLGISLGKIDISKFPDGEISLRLLESVRGRDVFVLQSIAIDPNLYLMELLIIIDALRRSSARTIVAVLPYFGYCRQDRKDIPRVPITAKLVANLIVEAGATRVLAVDLHAGQLQGFFDIPFDHIHGSKPLLERFKEFHSTDCIVVAPDVGSVKIARDFAHRLGLDFAIISKHRVSATDVDEVILLGEVKGKDVLLADDMCSTGGTLVSAAKACREKGAQRIFAAVTHGLCVGQSIEQIEKSPIEAVLMTNTIPYTDRLIRSNKLITVSIAPLLAHAIRCIMTDESFSSF
jgi:ribose-phosphate pyrophosphokinase